MRIMNLIIILALALSIMALGDPNPDKPLTDRAEDQQQMIEEYRYDVPSEPKEESETKLKQEEVSEAEEEQKE